MKAPWSLSWQLNERYTQWGDEQRGRFVAFLATEKMGIEEKRMDCLIEQLCTILPGAHRLVDKMHPDQLVRCLLDLGSVARSIVWLRQEFPTLNIERAASSYSRILAWTQEQVLGASDHLSNVLGSRENVNLLLEHSPWAIDAVEAESGIRTIGRLYSLGHDEAVKLAIERPGILELCVRCDSTLGPSDAYDPQTQSRQD